MVTNKSSPHLQIRHNFSDLLRADSNWLHPIVIAFNALCAVESYIQWCGTLHRIHWDSYLTKWFVRALEVNFLKKLPQLVAPHISGVGNPRTLIFHHIIIRFMWTYFWEHHIYYKKDTKVGSQNFGFQLWFCIRLLNVSFMCALEKNWLCFKEKRFTALSFLFYQCHCFFYAVA